MSTQEEYVCEYTCMCSKKHNCARAQNAHSCPWRFGIASDRGAAHVLCTCTCVFVRAALGFQAVEGPRHETLFHVMMQCQIYGTYGSGKKP
eukprot:583477-Pelagomonas_calceolata.AAC.3